MLDKRTSHFLKVVAKICDDGSYKIIEKTELLKEMNSKQQDFAALNQMVRYLQDNEMIDVKYSDETVFCLTVLPKGRVMHESMRHKGHETVGINRRTLFILVGACFLASIVGAMIGALIANLM